MDKSIILYVIMLIIGILLNIFIGKLAVFIFKKDGTGPRIPLRILGISLVINSISNLFHI